MEVISKDDININNICVGYSISSIGPVYFDLQKNHGTLILGSKKGQIRNYMKVMNQELDIVANKGTKVYFFDPDDSFKMEHYEKITYVEMAEIQNTINNLLIYINGENEKFINLENKSDYKAPSRSLLVFYGVSQIYRLLSDKVTELLVDAFAKARELELFDFLMIDVVNDFKEIQRHRTLTQMFVESNGVSISNAIDNQNTIDISSRDIRVKDALPDRQGYIIERGKAKLAQVLQFEGDEEEDDN